MTATATMMSLTERAKQAADARDASETRDLERRERQDLDRRIERLRAAMQAEFGISAANVLVEAETGHPVVVIDGLRFAVIMTNVGRSFSGASITELRLHVEVQCKRCGDGMWQRLEEWGSDQTLVELGRALRREYFHSGACPKDLDEDGEPKIETSAPAIRHIETAADLLVRAARALIQEELEGRQ